MKRATLKKLTALTLGLCMAAALSACNTKAPAPVDADNLVATDDPATMGGNAQIPNPVVAYDTMDAAAAVAGFALTLPAELPEGYELSAISVISETILQVTYVNGESQLTLRKAAGSEDISGIYGTYAEINTVTVNDSEAALKGENGKVFVATWVAGTYAYSISADDGLDAAAVESLIAAMQ